MFSDTLPRVVEVGRWLLDAIAFDDAEN